ncbi:aminotransferase class IV [Azospirillum sp. SYSU D00513]|uniref:aminotransferase class IV n=1 Tax=Azospirillum sp. SYSU D00513 TaxID=2812561 RepID=UPI001A961155|nr:aminotransferase class IV [Azospirillum sp. SYSU D00513]
MPVWLDGALVEDADARIAPNDRGFTLGDGLFETVRLRGGAVLRLDAHLARLRRGAALLGIPLHWTDEALGRALLETAQASGCAENGAARLTLTRGPAPRGVLPPRDPSPTLLVTAGPAPGPLPPARLVVARVTRRNEHSPLSQVKSLNYLDGILARREAEERGADDALLLNTAGRLAETTIANLFLVLDGRLVTPPLSEGALPGVMRAALLERFDAVEQALPPEALERASEFILTNSLGVRAVASVDGRPVGQGAPGPLFEALKQALDA